MAESERDPAEGRTLPRSAEHPILDRDPRLRNRARFLADQTRQWRRLAFGALALAFVLSLGLTVTATRPHSVPYYVLVDEAGQFVDAGRVEATTWDAPTLREALIRRWIKDVRTVYDSPTAQKDLVARAFAQVADDAAAYLSDYMARPENSPVTVLQQGTRSVEVIELVLPLQSADDYRVQWVEQTMDAAGRVAKRERWEAFLSVTLRPPVRATERRDNVAGFYLTKLQWSPLTALTP